MNTWIPEWVSNTIFFHRPCLWILYKNQTLVFIWISINPNGSFCSNRISYFQKGHPNKKKDSQTGHRPGPPNVKISIRWYCTSGKYSWAIRSFGRHRWPSPGTAFASYYKSPVLLYKGFTNCLPAVQFRYPFILRFLHSWPYCYCEKLC